MVIVVEKPPQPMRTAPPPPYAADTLPPFPLISRPSPTLPSLSPHLLLRIVYATFPQLPDRDRGKVQRQRLTLYWLNTSLRLVSKSLYIACMHVLRSTYLPAYSSLIRPPYSSDPFPQEQLDSRETKVLDLFIVLKVREDVYTDDSEFHLERDEAFKDLFELMQPKSRLEDLIRVYGLRENIVYLADQRPTSQQQCSSRRPQPVPFASLSVSFSTRKVGIIMSDRTPRKTIVEVPRTRDDKLELIAKRLIKGLQSKLSQDS